MSDANESKFKFTDSQEPCLFLKSLQDQNKDRPEWLQSKVAMISCPCGRCSPKTYA